MTALAEKLKEAGADTVGARLTAACVAAIRRHPGNPDAVWQVVGDNFGHEFVRGLMVDMMGGNKPPPKTIIDDLVDRITPENRHAEVGLAAAITPYAPRVIPPERLERRRELQQVVRSKYKNSAGVSWSDVSWHELVALARDGKEAAALLAACSASVPNDGRTVGDVLGVKETDSIIAAIRGAA